MKYKQSKKQNQRITRISEKTLVVGADIAKETHVARAIDFRGIELGKDCVFSNTRTGLEQLVQWMKELQQEHAKRDVLKRFWLRWIFCWRKSRERKKCLRCQA